MELTPLTAVSPVDGRYRRSTEALGAYFSEFALIRYRLHVEVEYFIALCEMPLPQLAGFDTSVHERMRKLVSGLTVQQAQAVKDIEKVTNHDVKAVEYFLKQEMESWGVGAEREFVHFGLTSQDINNTAVPLSIKEGIDEVIAPLFDKLIEKLSSMAEEWKDVSMLARTHGQPASPTRLGKEVRVFMERLRLQWEAASAVPHAAKFGGATGNLNAHCVAYPDQDWNAFANNFVEGCLGLTRSFPTTQIEHYDQLGARFDALKRVSVICIDLCRDMWTYISMEYFRQKIKEGEVGSSAMPHKVNPIDFENAEGNLGIAIALFEHLSAKLPVSRLQRDLTDSTVLRNVGMPLAHLLIALNSMMKGLDKVLLNKVALDNDLENNWAVVAEAVQTILRREGFDKPYEALKTLTRTNEKITRERMHTFIDSLDVSENVKSELKEVSPFNYTGLNA